MSSFDIFSDPNRPESEKLLQLIAFHKRVYEGKVSTYPGSRQYMKASELDERGERMCRVALRLLRNGNISMKCAPTDAICGRYFDKTR